MKTLLIVAAIMVAALLVTVAAAWLGSFVRAQKSVNNRNRARVATRATIAWIVAGAAMLLSPLVQFRELVWYGRGNMTFANIAEGRHDASLTKFADAAITTRHLLYKTGSDVDHIAVCGVADIPMGTVADEVATADLALQPVAVDLLGKGSTKRMVSVGNVSVGNPIFVAASGKVDTFGTTLVGWALTASVADGIFEVQDCPPTRVGFVTGSGGAVTQITSSSTGVTLSKPCGQITTVALTTAGAAEERFTVTNTLVAATDVIALSTTYNGAGVPMLSVVNVTAGTFDIVVTNVSASALNALMVINFAVLKTVAA